MSDFRETIRDVVVDRESGTAELCRNLRTNATFSAEIEEIQDTELNTELGRDARESVLMHVSDRTVAAAIVSQQHVAILLYGAWAEFTVVRRQDNPAKPQVEFGLMKRTEKDS